MVLRHALTDSRFTIQCEYCGGYAPRYVLRFCGEWLRSYDTLGEAETARTRAIEIHNEAIDNYGKEK